MLGRPVKIGLTREEVFYVHRGRHPVLMKMKTGVTRDGKLTGMHLQTLLDGGGYGSHGPASTFYTGVLKPVTYHYPRFKFEACRVFTNKPPCGPKRGHGTPQPRFGQEVQLDKIAEKLGIDPAELRLRNLVEAELAHRELAADRHHRPRASASARSPRCPAGKQASQAAERPRRRHRLQHLHVRRRRGDLLEQDAALRRADPARPQRPGDRVLRRDRDRPGLRRRARGLVAEALGIEFDVRCVTGDTGITPVDLGSYSSRVTIMAGNAAMQAAERLQATIAGAASETLGTLPDRWCFRRARCSLPTSPALA